MGITLEWFISEIVMLLIYFCFPN